MTIKKLAWIIGSLAVVIIIIIAYNVLSNLKKETPPTTVQQPHTTPSPTIDTSYGQKLKKTLSERPTPIITSDTQVRQSLINKLNGNTGDLTETPSFRLRYLKSANHFEATITSMPVNQAKNEVVSYLESQGLTEDGICKLPLIFFAGEEILSELRNTNIPFYPIPDFCL